MSDPEHLVKVPLTAEEKAALEWEASRQQHEHATPTRQHGRFVRRATSMRSVAHRLLRQGGLDQLVARYQRHRRRAG